MNNKNFPSLPPQGQQAKAVAPDVEKLCAYLELHGRAGYHMQNDKGPIKEAMRIAAALLRAQALPVADTASADADTPKTRGEMHSAIRKVMKHHKLTVHGDGVVEADLIAAVIAAIQQTQGK